jgi:hypothetical protein
MKKEKEKNWFRIKENELLIDKEIQEIKNQKEIEFSSENIEEKILDKINGIVFGLAYGDVFGCPVEGI